MLVLLLQIDGSPMRKAQVCKKLDQKQVGLFLIPKWCLNSRKTYLSSSGRRSQRRTVKILLSGGTTLRTNHGDWWLERREGTMHCITQTAHNDCINTFWVKRSKRELMCYSHCLCATFPLTNTISGNTFRALNMSLINKYQSVVSQSEAVTGAHSSWSFCHQYVSACAEAT